MKVTTFDYILCTVMVSIIFAMCLAGVVFGLHPLSTAYLGDYYVVADCVSFLLMYGIVSGLTIQVLLKLRPLQTGEFDMDSPNYTYWKLLNMIHDFGRSALVAFTPIFLRPVVALLFGAKIGKNVGLGGLMDDPFMVTLGNNVVTGVGSQLWGNVTNHGKITFGRVTIGNNVTIGMNVVVFPDVEIGDNATVALNSVVTQGARIPAGETWRGNPARKWQ